MKNTIIKVVVWVVVAIVAVVVIGSAAVGISSSQGKKELANSASSTLPELPSFDEVIATESDTAEWGSVVNPMDMIDEIENMTPAETLADGETVVESETSPAESTEALTEGSSEKESEQASEKQTETVSEKQSEKTTEKTTEKITEKMTEKVTEPTSQMPSSTAATQASTAATQPATQPTVPAVKPPVTNEAGVVTYNGSKYKYNDSILTFLVLGIDNNNKVSPAKDGISGGQSDALFLVVVNQNTKKMNIISIPRDSIAAVDVYNKSGQFVMTMNTYITLQHAYGDGMQLSNDRTVKAVSRMFYNLPIHGCVSINMGGIPALNDAIGGVDVTSLYTFQQGGYSFVEGQEYHLEGMGAYYYLKYRDTNRHYTATERLQRQRQYIRAFYNQAMNKVKSQPTLAIDIYNTISDYMVTDVSANEVSYLATRFISGGYSFGTMRTLAGTQVKGSKYEEYHVDQVALYELVLSTFYNVVE